MNEYLFLVGAAVAGLLLGVFFFGGLWLTVRKGLKSQRPALWFVGSMFLRTSVALCGFTWYRGEIGAPARLPSGVYRCPCPGQQVDEIVRPAPSLLRKGGRTLRLSPDDIVFWREGFFKLNATIFILGR